MKKKIFIVEKNQIIFLVLMFLFLPFLIIESIQLPQLEKEEIETTQKTEKKITTPLEKEEIEITQKTEKKITTPHTDNIAVEEKVIEKGIASWYGPGFHGRLTANGEVFNMYEMTAAHKELPFNTMVRVLFPKNGKEVLVRINDRGPFISGRIIDLSKRAAKLLGLKEYGIGQVEIKILKH